GGVPPPPLPGEPPSLPRPPRRLADQPLRRGARDLRLRLPLHDHSRGFPDRLGGVQPLRGQGREMSLRTELLRLRRDNRLIVGLILAVLVVWSVVSVLEQRTQELEPDTITRGILLFVLSYINITLIAAVVFVLGRILVKSWLERRRGVLGSRFQTRLLVTYLGLTAIPIGLLFFTALGLIQRSIDRWFSTPVREVVGRARAVQDMAEKRVVDETLEKARSVAKESPGEPAAARLDELRRQEKLDSIEVYRGSER